MKPFIVLINPKLGKNRAPAPKDSASREPLSILALGSFIKKMNIGVKLIDATLYEEAYVRKAISDMVKKRNKPLLIGCSVMTYQIPHALELCDFVKSLDPSIPIVWGGVHATLFPEMTSLDKSVDIVVPHRGELPLRAICTQLMDGKGIHGDIPGTCIKGKRSVAGKLLEISEYPYLDYELLDLKRYLGPLPHYLLSEKRKPDRALNVLSSRGCPWRCGFCINNATHNQWMPYSPKRYLDELCALINKFKLDAYRAMDEDFFVSKKRAFEIVDGLIERDIRLTWGTNIRANYFRDDYVSVDFAKKLKSTGCKFLSMGAESGNQRVLDLITKDITVKEIINSASVCNKAGIIPIYSWMIGIPTQTKKEMADTVSVMLDISHRCPTAIHYRFWVYRPFPGSSLYNLCIKKGLRVPKSLREWGTIRLDSNTGFYSATDLPWIKDIKFIQKLLSIFPKLPQ